MFNVVPAAVGRGELISLYVPYACPACSEDFEGLIDLRTQYDVLREKGPPERKCPRCAANADFDDLPSYYFARLGRSAPSLPPAAQALLAGNEGGAGPGSSAGFAAARQQLTSTVRALNTMLETKNRK